jgi:hypothetical protein
MLPKLVVVGFSGHRNLIDPKVVADAMRKVFDQLTSNHSQLATVSSAASGSDTLFIEESARRHLPFFLIFPFPQEQFQRDFSPSDWHRILPLIGRAMHVEEIEGVESAIEAYMETGVLTADRADVMVVVWDGKPAAGFGGTGDVVEYSRELKKPLIIIDPNSGGIAQERMEHFPAQSITAVWNEDPRETVNQHFMELDKKAQLHAPRSRDLILWIILIQLTASVIGSIATAFGIGGKGNQALTFFQLILLGSAFFLSFQHRKKHQQWMENRIAAEICRSFLATWHIRCMNYCPPISIKGFTGLCKDLRLIRLMDKTLQLPLESVRGQYLKERVENQIAYFSHYSSESRLICKNLKTVASYSTAAAAILSLLVLTFSVLRDFVVVPYVPSLVLEIPKFLSLLLPLASAGIFSVISTHDYSRRAIRYGEMASLLENAAKRLKMVRTWNSLARVATEVEEELLQEIVEWHSFRRFVGGLH